MSEYIMYLRKSRQDEPNETVEEVLKKHEIQLQEYALNNFKYKIPNEDIYREVVSGETIDDRPMMQEVLKRIENSSIKGVLVIDCQRLTRGDMLDCGTIVHSFRYSNTLIITPPKTYRLDDKYDRKFFEMELSRGSDYLEYTKEILKRGRDASKRRGNYIGSVAPYGYDRVKIGNDWTLKPNDESQYIKYIFERYTQGIGTAQIANELDALGAKPRHSEYFNHTRIRKIIENPVYVGKIKVNSTEIRKELVDGKIVNKKIYKKEYEIVDGKHEPLISQEMFDKAQKEKEKRTCNNTSTELVNPYASIMKCGYCGSAIVNYYNNMTRKKAKRFRCANKKCNCVSHNFDVVNDAIIKALKNKLEDIEVQIDTNTPQNNNNAKNIAKTLEKRINENEKKLNDICTYLENGVYTIDMFTKRKEILENEKATLEKALENAKKETESSIELKEKSLTLHKAIDMLKDDTISAKVKNNFLKKIISVIYYKKDKNGNIFIDVHLC